MEACCCVGWRLRRVRWWSWPRFGRHCCEWSWRPNRIGRRPELQMKTPRPAGAGIRWKSHRLGGSKFQTWSVHWTNVHFLKFQMIERLRFWSGLKTQSLVIWMSKYLCLFYFGNRVFHEFSSLDIWASAGKDKSHKSKISFTAICNEIFLRNQCIHFKEKS